MIVGEDRLYSKAKIPEICFKKQRTDDTAIAHNARGYDSYFLLSYLTDIQWKQDNAHACGKGIIDSLNIFPMQLAALPKAFGLKEIKKGYFPHFMNTAANQKYVGPYPPPSMY